MILQAFARNALHGDALSNFSIEERMSWAKHRKKKLEEDQTYSLLGMGAVLGVQCTCTWVTSEEGPGR